MRKCFSVLILLLFAALNLSAQFLTQGTDPGNVRWFSLESAHYKIIYPQGADSLARNYATLLEQYRVPTGRSIGLIPGERQKRPLPVVLHTFNPYSNGSVSWAPSRMDLYTLPEHGGSDPAPWDIQLVTHEPRHQAQLSIPFVKPLNWILGEAWPPILWYIYINRTLGEGDAVAVETGLSPGTRARTADFLNYFQVAFDQGDFRNWNRWRFGSYKKFTPDLYKLGYMTVAGERYLYNDPMVMQEALEASRKNPFRISAANFRHVQKQYSGKRFKESFGDVMQAFNQIWQDDAAARAPYTPFQQESPVESFPVEYASPVELNGEIYLYREGYLRAKELGKWQNAQFVHLKAFASHTSSLFPEPVRGRLYWSETFNHPRWELAGTSVIRYMDVASGKIHTLTHQGRLYNPQPSPDGATLAVISAPYNGGSYVEVISADNGAVLRRTRVPDGLQATESAWIGEMLYVSAISDQGYGIYSLTPQGEWAQVLEPSIQKVVNMGSGADYIEWMSDRDGANALYHFYPASGELLQITSTRFGATDYCEAEDGLYAIMQKQEGRMLVWAPRDSLRPREVSFADVHRYPIEDKITEQEQALGPVPATEPVELSQPKRYYNLPHALRFHTWAPLYFDYNEVDAGSLDYVYDAVAPGLSAYFQNTLGTVYGMLGYAFSPDSKGTWRHSGHARVVWKGWIPVVEASVDLNDRGALQYFFLQRMRGHLGTVSRMGMWFPGKPMAAATVKAYIPLSWSRGGVLYGVTPQLNYSITNDLFSRVPVRQIAPEASMDGVLPYHFLESAPADNVFMQRGSASVRGYVMRPRAESQIYPRWGLGAEVGYSLRPGLQEYFAPNLYAYAYGYLPGLWRTQGLRWTAMWQQSLGEKEGGFLFRELSANTLPRGFQSDAGTAVAMASRSQFKVTADYAIPIYVGDISLGPIAYIRNFVLTPHIDYSVFGSYNLWSAGADFTVSLGRLPGIPFPASLGVSASYLGGSFMASCGQEKPYSVSMIFSIDI